MRAARRPFTARSAASAAAAALTTVMMGCSLLVSTTNLAGGEGAGVKEDGGGLTDGSSPLDGSSSLDDGRASPDGGDASGTPIPFCQSSTHTFCDDFDDVAGGGTTWWEANGPMTRSKERAKSAPSSMLATIPRRAANAPDQYSALKKTVNGPWQHIVVEFDLWFESPQWQPTDSNVGICCISYLSNSSSGDSCMSVAQDYTSVAVANTFAPNGPPIPFGQWVHVKVDFDPTKEITVRVGGSTQYKAFAPMVAGGTPSMTIDIGLMGYNEPVPSFTTYFDNVTIDLL